jgi:hypothetical protein
MASMSRAYPAARQPWTPEQAAEYAARREFRLIELLSQNRRAEATARRLGVFGFARPPPSLPGAASDKVTGRGAGTRESREPSKRQQKLKQRSADRAAVFQSQLSRARDHFRRSPSAAELLSGFFLRWRRQFSRRQSLRSFIARTQAGVPSSAPVQQFVFNAGADMQFDFGAGTVPPSLAPPLPPPAKRDAGERPPRAADDSAATPDAKRSQAAPSDPDAPMDSEPPPSPPRDFARAELELLQEASDTLATRSSSGCDGGHYSLQSPPLGRGRGRGGR